MSNQSGSRNLHVLKQNSGKNINSYKEIKGNSSQRIMHNIIVQVEVIVQYIIF